MSDNNSSTSDRRVTFIKDLPLTLITNKTTVDINDPEFEKLTAAEKLNSSKYRSFIYRCYPNEPTCGCKPLTEQSTGTRDIDNHKSNEYFLVCRGGCKNSCCSGAMRSRVAKNQDNGNYDKVSRIMSTYCVGNQPSNKVYNGTHCPDNDRTRGGGGEGVEEVYCEYGNFELTGCPRNVENARLRGGGGGSQDYSRRNYVNKSHEVETYFLSSKFHHNYTNEFSQLNNPTPEYVCSDREEFFKSPKTNKKTCTRERCTHITCLTRKFKEAQEFVDSLGKVPGVAGLGLMDPSESPYFRATREPEKHEEMSRTFSPQPLTIVNPQCGGPYNLAIKSTSTSPWIKATPFTISVPGRGGIVQEAIIPGTYGRDKYNVDELSGDDKTGPCGKSMCRARRKKINRPRSSNATDTGIKLDLSNEKKMKNHKREKKHKLRRKKGQTTRHYKDEFELKNKVKKNNYVYLSHKPYSESVHGHKNCNDSLGRVPHNMGWLWTQYQAVGKLKPRAGWKPGAISRQIREILKDARGGMIEVRSRVSLASSGEMREKKLKSKSHVSLRKGQSKKFDEEEEFEPPPTLHIQRRDGVYYVTMHPVKREKKNDISKVDQPMKPLQFKIKPKSGDNANDMISTASDMEIEFSPPAAINRHKKKPNVIHVETQVRQQEILDAFKPGDEKINEIKKKKK